MTPCHLFYYICKKFFDIKLKYMPFPVAAAIMGGAALAGGIANNISTGSQNKKSREWSYKMYNLQKNDNIRHWQRQNEYNTPSAQMERLRAAGLNPNLIYGKGAGAANQADQIKTADVKQAQFNAPDFSYLSQGTNSAINTYFDVELKQAQIDNLRADNTVKQADAALKLAAGDRTKFDLDLDTELRGVSSDARKEALRQLQVNNNYTLSKWEREALKNTSDLNEAAVRIAKMRVSMSKDKSDMKKNLQQIQLMKKDTKLKALQIELNKLGVQKGDALIERIVARYINQYLLKN
ncbi:DNA pilot protein [Microviridae sp.]|nr:DNA pilot protein [Microviridae sp.]